MGVWVCMGAKGRLWACPASWLSLLRCWGCPCGHRRHSESDVRVCLCCLSLFALAHPHKATTRITHTNMHTHTTHTQTHILAYICINAFVFAVAVCLCRCKTHFDKMQTYVICMKLTDWQRGARNVGGGERSWCWGNGQLETPSWQAGNNWFVMQNPYKTCCKNKLIYMHFSNCVNPNSAFE